MCRGTALFFIGTQGLRLSNVNDALAGFVTSGTYLEHHRRDGGEVFGSKHSLEWFCRVHRHRLVKEGQFIARRGPSGNLLGPLFSELALSILQESITTAPQQMAVKGSQDSSTF